MKKIASRVLLLLLLVPPSLTARTYYGREIISFSHSAQSMGRGGTGVASSGVDLFSLNPASVADLERIGLGAQYGSLPSYVRYDDLNVTAAIPTSYGVIGSAFRYCYMPDSRDFQRGYAASLGSAKDITPKVLIGLSLNFFKGERNGSSYYAGGSLGFIYKFNSTGSRHGFGIFNTRLGIAVNFGYPFGSHRGRVDFNSATVGYTFQFFRIKEFSLGLFNDASAVNYREFPVKIGLEAAIYNILVLRGGYVIPHAYNEGSFTAGIGLGIDRDRFKGNINYAVSFHKGIEHVHYLGMTCEFGKLDTAPPETAISPDYQYVSPNHDGERDYVLFSIDVKDASRIKGWRLKVLDDKNEIVKEYAITERDFITRLNFKSFFKRMFQKRESMVVPEKIIWDGTNRKGEVAPDGRYYYSFTAWDERDNIALLKTGDIFIDNTPPEVKLTKKDDLFSPNRDNRKEVYSIYQAIKSSPDDQWEAGFKDSGGKIIKSYQWDGNSVPKVVTWDGTDDSGNDAPEGVYSYFIHSTDRAGNKAAGDIPEITLTRQYEIADITISSGYFSHALNETVNFFPRLSGAYGIEGWTVIILDSKKKAVREISGEGMCPKMIEFDCRDQSGTKLDDGVYYVQFRSRFKSGNEPQSFEKTLIVDSSPPRLSVSHSPGLFSPDGDRENDILTIKTDVKEDFGIKSWNILVYSSAGELFRTFMGEGDVPREIIWDGIGDNLDLVESAADYFVVLEAVDTAGNMGRSSNHRIQVDILVIVTERGLKIRISNIEFSFGSDSLKWSGKRILDRVFSILQKYGEYSIVIEGHTDDIGKEEYNLELSERRARVVYDYLVRRGISESRLTFLGMGETVPLYPNTNDESRRRNRRVEFILIKQEP